MEERKRQPLQPGRQRRNAVSTTRRRLDLVVEGANPVRCLETNLFSTSTSTASELSVASRSTRVFDFLLQAIQPSLIVAHGVPASTYLQEHVGGTVVWPVKTPVAGLDPRKRSRTRSADPRTPNPKLRLDAVVSYSRLPAPKRVARPQTGHNGP